MVAADPELWFNRGMDKLKAIELLGGSVTAAASTIGISYQAVEKWPDPLPRRIEDRVLAALARKYLSPEQLGESVPPGGDALPPPAAAFGMQLSANQASG
jgi:hypothetical protein